MQVKIKDMISRVVWWPGLVAWLAIATLAGFLLSKLFGINFWIGFGITAGGLIVNGWLAESEDKSTHAEDDSRRER